MKRMIIHLVVPALVIALAATTYAAVRAKCTVKEVKENVVILDCGEKSSEIKVDDQITLRVNKKSAPIEGC
ncbi:MAG: hypothetical protein D3909_17100 [Candidatus Electrothrix sp. ATG1]|nr:hypothetical protein [Candidatus Electrothrix sp. ATG1]MCI5210643.1 hypothetical protein [Candidatus Electrothrix sp. ATG2]